MKSFVPYSPWTRKLFNSYLYWNFKKSFENIYCLGLSSLREVKTPLIFVSNHVSWWDGFFLFEIQRRIRPNAQIYTVALEKTCRENSILPRMGVLPLQPGNPGSLKAILNHLQKIRSQIAPEDLVVSFFPQGKITPSFRKELEFQRGIESVISSLAPATVVPIGIHIEPMTGKKPTAILSVGTPVLCADKVQAKEIEIKVQESLTLVHQHLNDNGEALPKVFESWFS
ncbi:MAG: lysophospholipid acyltransferase family protein [Pseudomonadota bacterium]